MISFKTIITIIISAKKRCIPFIVAILVLFSLFSSSTLYANSNLENKYKPYFEMGGIKYFNQHSNAAGVYDLFIPLLQSPDQLFFTDLRIFDRSGNSFEGNAHIGYRRLLPNVEQMIGIYGAFDRKKSIYGNWFNQITLGIEYWQNKWFFGGNVYCPVGQKEKNVGEVQYEERKTKVPLLFKYNIEEKTGQYYEKPTSGFDAEIGYAFTGRLTGYVGGYYFADDNVDTIVGSKVRITYNYMKPIGRILGVFDGISIEAGGQHDKPRGTSGYIGIKLKFGLTNLTKETSNNLEFERHMTELVRRDQDIVVQRTIMPKIQIITKIREFTQKEYKNYLEFFTYSQINNVSKNMLLDFLGLPETATWEEAHKRYKEFALEYHPDKFNGDNTLMIIANNVTKRLKILCSYDNNLGEAHAGIYVNHPDPNAFDATALVLPYKNRSIEISQQPYYEPKPPNNESAINITKAANNDATNVTIATSSPDSSETKTDQQIHSWKAYSQYLGTVISSQAHEWLSYAIEHYSRSAYTESNPLIWGICSVVEEGIAITYSLVEGDPEFTRWKMLEKVTYRLGRTAIAMTHYSQLIASDKIAIVMTTKGSLINPIFNNGNVSTAFIDTTGFITTEVCFANIEAVLGHYTSFLNSHPWWWAGIKATEFGGCYLAGDFFGEEISKITKEADPFYVQVISYTSLIVSSGFLLKSCIASLAMPNPITIGGCVAIIAGITLLPAVITPIIFSNTE